MAEQKSLMFIGSLKRHEIPRKHDRLVIWRFKICIVDDLIIARSPSSKRLHCFSHNLPPVSHVAFTPVLNIGKIHEH